MGYPGGKGGIYRSIIGLMGPHDTYIETHLGGGAVMRNKRPARRNIGVEIDIKVVSRWKDERLAPFCEVVHADAVTFLRSFPFTGGELVYVDPPYLPETRRRHRIYAHEYDVDQHVDLLRTLAGLPCAVVLSGYASDLYDATLLDWRRVEFKAVTQVGPATEVAWLNFAAPETLHDLRFLGADFREREGIRRRRDGLLARIAALDPRERQALFRSLLGQHADEVALALEHSL